MKLLIIALLFISSSAFADDWSKADVARETVLLVIHAVDWGQTRNIAKNPSQYAELNPFLGVHPSVSRVDNYFVLTGLAHVGISHVLPSEWRKGWQYVTIGIGGANIARNHSIGLRVSF